MNQILKIGIFIIILMGVLIFIHSFFNSGRIVSYKHKTPIPERKGTVVFQVEPTLFEPKNDLQYLFEHEDLVYYDTPFTNHGDLDIDLEHQVVHVLNPDKQNVHDTVVQKYIRRENADLDTSIGKQSFNLDEILAQCPPDKIKQVKKVLETMKTNRRIDNIDKTELELLAQVWSQALKDNCIKEALYQNLADCIEEGLVVCATGIATRITSSLYVLDPDKAPKTKEMIHANMMQLASQVQKDNPELQGPELQVKIKEALYHAFQGVLDTSEVNQYIAPWIQSI